MNTKKRESKIDLSKFDKNKKWIIFYKKGCSNCFQAKKYFEIEGIKHCSYDIGTKNGLAMAAFWSVLEECEKGVPIIIEDIQE